jgi:hypothetical protein
MAILAMSDHGQDARATSELTLKGAVEEGLEKVVQAGTEDLFCKSAVLALGT